MTTTYLTSRDQWSEIQLLQLEVKNLNLIGHSVAGSKSCIMVPQFGIAFDYGFPSEIGISQEMVAVTHGHGDHIGALHLHAFERRMSRMSKPKYLLPDDCLRPFNDAHDAYKAMNRHSYDKPEVVLTRQYDLIGSSESTADLIKIPKASYYIKAYPTIHGVPSVGYVVFDRRKKLKEEYRGLPGKKIGQLAKEGAQINHQVDVPIFGYTGDTTIQGVMQHQEFTNCQVLMMECTYIGLDERDTVEECQSRGHIHLDQIVQNWRSFNNEFIVLCHFSRRYKRQQILDQIEKINQNFTGGPLLMTFI